MHSVKWINPIRKIYILFDSNDITFWKWYNYRDIKISVVARGSEEGKDWIDLCNVLF